MFGAGRAITAFSHSSQVAAETILPKNILLMVYSLVLIYSLIHQSKKINKARE